MLLAAPTGAGKSLIAEGVRRALGVDGCYVVQTKTLQAQVASGEKGFGAYARVIMGRENYPTQLKPELFTAPWGRRVTCAECAGDSCRLCASRNSCPYRLAKTMAGSSVLPILNTAYFLGETNGAKSMFAGRGLVVFDEGDSLEDEIMRHVTITISDRRAEALGIDKPKVTVAEGWWEWAEHHATPAVMAKLADLHGSSEPQDVRERTSLVRLAANLMLLEPREDEEVRWVYTGAGARDTSDRRIEFRPVTVESIAPSYCFGEHGGRYLLMSATFISPEIVAEGLGLDPEEVGVVEMESTFDVERRPVYVDTVGSVTHKTKGEMYPKLADKIIELLTKHDGERTLIHTVSYDLADFLVRHIARGNVRMYRQASEREELLRWLRASPGAVLCAPSFERGIDLPYDACRVVIVAKVPYPNLGDAQVNARLRTTRNGQLWYCLAPETRILRGDLRWIPSVKLEKGDSILAFDESPPTPGLARRWRQATVEAVEEITRPCYRIYLEDGNTIVASAEHLWMVARPGASSLRWVRTDQLMGCRIAKPLDTWKEDATWAGGYLAAAFDGEGSLSQRKNYQEGTNALQLHLSQRANEMCSTIEIAAEELGFTIKPYSNRRDDTRQYAVLGGKREVLRFLGQIRPRRLLAKLDLTQLGTLKRANGVRVTRLVAVGEQRVIATQTSTRTLLAEGLASHNSTQTIKRLVQQTGRGMRAADDRMDAYILDYEFIRLWGRRRRLFPKWWRDALVFTKRGGR